ncbi:MAG: hypothetical protein MJE63_21015 [Proteobacteria bacterium]|nr:hypothetical protein [Pseudomonadota bacterium]
MSETLNDLIKDLHQMQILLNFMIKGLAALATDTADHKLRPGEHEALQVAEYAHDMVDQMIKRVEEALKAEFGKPNRR